MGESIWKKEISFGKKSKPSAEPKAEDVTPAPEKTSVWKKEISLGRKAKKEEAPPVARAPQQSVWKKEISLGRKAKKEKEAAPPVAETPAPAAKQSVWKKDISLGRKKKAEPVAEEVSPLWLSFGSDARAAQAPVPAAKQSMWKKEISLGRKKRDREVERLAQEAEQAVSPAYVAAEPPVIDAPAPTELAEAAVAAMPQPEAVVAPEPAPVAPEPVVEVEPVVAAEPVAPAAVVSVEPEPVALAAVPDPEPVALAPVEPQPVDAAQATAVPELPVDPEPAPAPVAPAGLSPEIIAASAEPEPAVPVAPQPPAESAYAAPVPEPVQPQPVEPAYTAPVPEPVQQQYVAPEPVQQQYVAPEPVQQQYVAPEPAQPAASAYEPVLEQAPVESWMEPQPVEAWAAPPEVPPAPQAPAPVVVHPPVASAELPPLPEPKVPFWKKELSFGKPKAPKQPKAPKAASTPFWKKELSLSRKSAPAPVADAPTQQIPVPAPKAKSAPFWKRELGGPSLSMPSLSRPQKRSSGGKGRGGHKVKRFVGLKVGGSQLAAARVANNGAVELLQVAREPLEQGVVVSGELRDVDTLAEALKRFFARNKLPRKNVRLGIASNRIGVRIFDVPGITDDKQLENAIHFRAQETLPIPLDEAVLDYHVVGEGADEEGNVTRRILLVVAYRELVDRYVAACKKAGISLAGIDLEAFALLRALSAPRPEGEQSDSALVAVAIGHDRSTFAVSDGRICEFTRVLEWGGSALNVAIARALNLAPSEVEAIKRALSLESVEVPQGIAPDQYALALDAVRKQVQGFARELVSSLQFYQNQPGSLGIGEIVITGGTASLVGLAGELQRLIGVRVRVGDPLARVRVAKRVDTDEGVGSLAVAIGLGIDD